MINKVSQGLNDSEPAMDEHSNMILIGFVCEPESYLSSVLDRNTLPTFGAQSLVVPETSLLCGPCVAAIVQYCLASFIKINKLQ